MTHMEYATETADAQVGRIIQALEDSGEMDDTLVMLTADHGSVAADADQFNGDFEPENDYGYDNWYYGSPAHDVPHLRPQDALLPLIDGTDDGAGPERRPVLQRLVAPRVAEGPVLRGGRRSRGDHGGLPDVTAVWRRDGDRYVRVSPVRWDRMQGAEKLWFSRKAQELVDTRAAAHGPDLIATLPDDTTYSVLGDHGGIRQHVAPGPARGGAVGRHHADDPACDGYRTVRPDGRHRLRAADTAAAVRPIGEGERGPEPAAGLRRESAVDRWSTVGLIAYTRTHDRDAGAGGGEGRRRPLGRRPARAGS